MPRTGAGRARPPNGQVGRAGRIFQKDHYGEAGSSESRSNPSRRRTMGQAVITGAAKAKATGREDKDKTTSRRWSAKAVRE
jgi:hypothetical protein